MKRVIDGSDVVNDYADASFSTAVIGWQKTHGRHALPWQNTRDAYRIWLSEIMLQQTQVTAVIPYYQRFLESFPDVATLAAAPSEAVMALWSGLGYYTRARNLHRCAQRVVAEYGGLFPSDPELLADLPGIGRSTAAAIAAFSYGKRAAILDGNVKRVFARVFGVEGYPGSKAVEDLLWRRAVALLPSENIESYTQGLMDLGATLCTRSRPACGNCPLQARCVAFASDRVSELPIRKPKKALREKSTAMLLLVDQGHVLLEQRPDSGIWGGLLSLPEIAASTAADDAVFDTALALIVARFGEMDDYCKLQPFSHTFTHFKLHIAPYRITLARRLHQAAEAGYLWYPQHKLHAAPLPAPVKKLLLELFGEADLLTPLN
ncbi:A/G-specific adenine glycosylase [Herbaspirillum sp. RTI4]|uniref:A/G-specific adenine glycosylase n=1 Tax=Herbaspirillum sp. RTI4 TaxID=3048640 RepID=UPI002AB33896|nr:A/G-specific adenine glycosylase [Herbaspirillum sp. RTI4]MDY7577853.1 A/G-specific adenine glycosylase [Herbaspirillum sp. RTI4]MEA9982471.1 A/G-specific adenine glycosylase [Herbaspirillum sp. RTI4]